MKYKTADLQHWPRVPERRFALTYLNTPAYRGYVSLLLIDRVTDPLVVPFGEQQICVIDQDYIWLQHFPDRAFYSLTTAFNACGEVVQWYVDICHPYKLDERGIPGFVDLYLDIVISPESKTLLLDVNELDRALVNGDVTASEYNIAWRTATTLLTAIEEDRFPLLYQSAAHRDQLLASKLD